MMWMFFEDKALVVTLAAVAWFLSSVIFSFLGKKLFKEKTMVEICSMGVASIGVFIYLFCFSCALDTRGFSLYEEGDYKNAKIKLERCSMKGCSKHQYLLGMSLIHMGQAEKGKEWIEKAAEKGNRKATRKIALIEAVSNNEERAEYWYRKLVLEENIEAQIELANLFRKWSKYRKAENEYRELIMSGHSEYRNALLSVLEKQGKYEEVAKWKLSNKYVEAMKEGARDE